MYISSISYSNSPRTLASLSDVRFFVDFGNGSSIYISLPFVRREAFINYMEYAADQDARFR